MPGPLLSNLWYRVVNLKPKLRSHARLHRHRYRSRVWYLIQDPASGRVHRFTPSARLVIALMDGKRTVGELWEIANRRLGEDAPTQDEIIQLLGQLHAADLLQSDVTPDAAELFARSEREIRIRHRRSYGNPMAIRIPLWDPDAFLNRFRGLCGLVWGRWGALLWLAVVLPAFVLIFPHWPDLSNNFTDRVLSVDNLFIIYLIFPVLKMFHEMGHASATKAGGGEVHDLGMIFLVLLPVPYVEASASTTFTSKYRRAMVGAAGVAVELLIAAVAFYVWLAIEPGLMRAVLFNVMVVAGVSTLIFNGNPLLRYDAYYVLADLIEMPNLAQRSLRYWSYLCERYVLGMHEIDPPDASRSEKAWLIVYGALSTIYRILVSVFIALFIATRFFFIGVLLAIWSIFAMAVIPLIKGVRHIMLSPRLRRHRTRAIAISTLSVGGLVALLLLAPVPSHTHAEGVVWLPEQSLVRASANCFLAEFILQPGREATIGDPLIRCHDPSLESQQQDAEARVDEWLATYAADIVVDQVKAKVSLAELVEARANLATIRERVSELVVHANASGVFVVSQMNDMLGNYYKKGELLGYVIGDAQKLVRVVVPQDAVDRVRASTDRVRVRIVDDLETSVAGRIIREVPAGNEVLPSRALAIDGGGEIATDPRETHSAKAMQRMFQFDVQLDASEPINRYGQRTFVRFEHQEEPLLVQWYRALRLMFLSRFSV